MINEVEAPIRKLIYEIFLRTMRKKTTADELNRLGYRTRKGALFSDITIDRLLKDTTAKGERIANYTKNTEDRKRTVLKPKSEWIIMRCPSIVSLQIWNKVNNILVEQERKSVRIGRRSSVYLLSGFVKRSCSKMMYIKNPNKMYYCKDCKIKIAVGDIDEIYWGYLSDCLMNIKMLASIKNSTNIKKKQALIEKTKDEKKLLVKTLQNYVSMRLDGEITKEKLVGDIHFLYPQLLQVEELLLKVQSEMKIEQLQIKYREVLLSKAEHLVRDWHGMPFEKKRSIIESVTEEVSIREKDIRMIFSIDLSILFRVEDSLHSDIPALPCLRFENQTRRKVHPSYPENPSTIGEHIRRKRIDLKSLQSDAAKILNLSPDCITNWENNRTQPQGNYFPRIIEFLGFFPFVFDTSTFIGKLKAYRFGNGLSHKRLGKILNVDATTIRAWEAGERKPLKGMLAKLNKIFDNAVDR